MAVYKEQLNSDEKDRKPTYRHNHQLEELRNIQDKLNQDKEAWLREKEMEEKELEEKRCKLFLLEVSYFLVVNKIFLTQNFSFNKTYIKIFL